MTIRAKVMSFLVGAPICDNDLIDLIVPNGVQNFFFDCSAACKLSLLEDLRVTRVIVIIRQKFRSGAFRDRTRPIRFPKGRLDAIARRIILVGCIGVRFDFDSIRLKSRFERLR